MLESVTSKLSGIAFATALGVPVIAPVDTLNARPAGNVPAASDQV